MFQDFSFVNSLFKNSLSLKIIDGDKSKMKEINELNFPKEEIKRENPITNEIQNEIKNKDNIIKEQEIKNDNIIKKQEINEESKNIVKIIQTDTTREEILTIPQKKYPIITQKNSLISLPENYSTDIEKEQELINLYNENHSPGNNNNWIPAKSKMGLEIYLKDAICHDVEKTRSLYLKTIGTISYPIDIIWKYLLDFEFRKTCEPVYKQGKLIEEINGNPIIKIVYALIKMPFFMTDREILSKQFYFTNYAGQENKHLLLEYSIERDDFPIKEKPLRAEWEIRGIYIEKKNDKETIVKLCGLFNMKFNQDFIVKQLHTKGPEGQDRFFTEFPKYLKDFVKKKKL